MDAACELRSGRLPNVFWGAVSAEDLRGEPRFEALPPAYRILLGGLESQR